MKAKWTTNKGKLKVCRSEVKEQAGRRRPLVLHRRLHEQDLRFETSYPEGKIRA